VAGGGALIEQQPVAELGVLTVGIEDRVREFGLLELAVGDRAGEPGVVVAGRARGDSGLHAVLDVGLTDPLRDRHLVSPDVLGDLGQRYTGTTVAGDPDDVFAELARVGLGRSNILPAWQPVKRSQMSQIRSSAPRTANAVGSAGGRPPTFDPTTHKSRNVIERSFNDHMQLRAIATRHDKTAAVCPGAITIWLTHLGDTP
jgi:hypothetical protein